MNPMGWILIAVGAFAMAGGICNWDWFMNDKKARLIVKVFSRDGARIFYGILGLLILVAGLLGTVGVIDAPQ
ncbi:immunity 17 family protein [Pontiella sulfatireligans]|uniref:Immunity protein 17 n=1 Tax=Pontiella sulfatireligans TaxID=2750658 RepID=A0A6C2UM91_9BACT|nr:immunity 17 family protein [Pontiella sulfatireligans]VGO21392.1 hypothetical protein SCARR_03465 [Pontiella sulfatireligans]